MKSENGVSHKRRTNSRAFENLERRAVALLRHFFPVSRFRRYEWMHKYTLPVNKISRPRRKDSRAVYRTSCAIVMPRSLATQTRPIAFFFLSPLVTLFIFSPALPFSLALRYKYESDALELVNRRVKKCHRIIIKSHSPLR